MEEFDLINGQQNQQNPKRHSLARVRIIWAIKHKNLLTSLTCRWVLKKERINKQIKIIVIFHLFAQKLPWTDLHLICYYSRGHLRNYLWQICLWLVKEGSNLWGKGGSKTKGSHWRSLLPLPHSKWYYLTFAVSSLIMHFLSYILCTYTECCKSVNFKALVIIWWIVLRMQQKQLLLTHHVMSLLKWTRRPSFLARRHTTQPLTSLMTGGITTTRSCSYLSRILATVSMFGGSRTTKGFVDQICCGL